MNKINLDIQKIYWGHFNMTYRGIRAVKCPFDYVIYQMLINEVQPDLIIEIGALEGGSTLYMVDILEKIGNGIVHTIDIDKRVTSELVLNHPRIKYFYEGGYEGYDVRNATGFNRVLIIDDGSHNYVDVKNAFYKLNSLVSFNSYYIIEDGAMIDTLNIRDTFGGGPTVAIEEILKENLDFKSDDKWVNFFGPMSTFNGLGYLKKIKSNNFSYGYGRL